MASAKTPQLTDFTVDILGRYMGNGLDEALHSIDKNAQRPDGTPQSDARPFNAIIIGGGSFGGVLAQHLLYADKTNHYRILVLEAGRHSLPEHFQNLPLQSQPSEVWGLAWKADPALKYPGLAYTIGGRSLFFGGWSPRLLDEEMPAALQMPPEHREARQRVLGDDAQLMRQRRENHRRVENTLMIRDEYVGGARRYPLEAFNPDAHTGGAQD